MEFTGERVVPGLVEPGLWAEHVARYEFAVPLVEGRTVLDLGSGAGYGAARLARTARAVVGVDISREAAGYSRVRYRQEAGFVTGRCEALPFASGAFQGVVAFEVIEHVLDAGSLLSEARRVLSADGIFVVSTPNRHYYTTERGEQNPFHTREFDLLEFQALLQEYFLTVELWGQNHVPAVVVSPIQALRGHDQVAAGFVDLAGREDQRHPHFILAVCGTPAIRPRGLVALPEGRDNVLRARERHVDLLSAEVQQSRSEVVRLQAELEGRTVWARSLEAELERTRGDHQAAALEVGRLREAMASASRPGSEAEAERVRLEAMVEERTAWAKRADEQFQAAEAERTRLASVVEERTEWARRIDQQLQAAEAERLRLEAIVEERTAWAKRADGQFQAAEAERQRVVALVEERTEWARRTEQEFWVAEAERLRLVAEVEERTAWAKRADEQYQLAEAERLRLAELLEERTAWAKRGDEQYQVAESERLRLAELLEERTAWAKRADEQYQVAEAERQRLEADLEERLAWVRRVEADLEHARNSHGTSRG